ncbi:hypothetical protein BKI52_14055 [marine bacterium AO1-C]|nr:hypothetical protein BKI52_14055 [marine bacterium AO1-C]
MQKRLKKQFVTILQEHQGIIHQICRVYFVVPQDREDAFQEVVLQLWKAFPKFRQEAKVTTWMYRVALNTILKKVRQEQARQHLTPLEEAEPQAITHRTSETNDYLEYALLQLPPVDKALVILHLEGYNYEEIAQILNLTKTNVASKLSRIKQKMKQIITQEKYAAQ